MSELFSAFGIEWKLLLAQAVNFGIVLVALTYFLYKPILRILEERRTKIEHGVKAAEEAERAAKANREARESIVTAAQKEAESIVMRAADEGKRVREETVKSGQARAEGILRDAEAQAEELKRHTLREQEKDIVRAAILAAEKILRKS